MSFIQRAVWTKISDGCYQFNDTSYEALKSQHMSGTRWWVCFNGQILSDLPSEPSREFAGYAIQSLIAEVSQ
jgi:hypothetical protein